MRKAVKDRKEAEIASERALIDPRRVYAHHTGVRILRAITIWTYIPLCLMSASRYGRCTFNGTSEKVGTTVKKA
jgi:hypothetical protein